MWLLCLDAQQGTDLRTPLRAGASPAELEGLITGRWQVRQDRGAEERQELGTRGPLLQIEGLKKDPHLEMHTRGG
jgi:cyclic pyranopterin phosphate synthase